MAEITLRSVKGSPLTNEEVDNNFTNLNNDKVEDGDSLSALSISSVTITGGTITGITDLAIADGGTGASTAENARSNLGLVIGTNIQAWNTNLDNLASLSKTNGNFIVAVDSLWTVQSPSTVRSTLGLGTIAVQDSSGVSISGGTITGITDLAIADGGTGASTAENARSNLGLGSLAVLSSINNSNWSGTALAVANGGTGATTTGGARSNLGLGSLAVLSSINNSNWSGAALTVANGGTGSTTTDGIRTTIGLATNSNVQFSSLGVGTAPSGSAGEIRATGNITGFYSSDRRFKENIKDIDSALEKVISIGGKTFEWSDKYIDQMGGLDDYFMLKQDFGVIAQDVKEVFPLAVKQRSDGSLAVDYPKLCALAFAAIKELSERIEKLENK